MLYINIFYRTFVCNFSPKVQTWDALVAISQAQTLTISLYSLTVVIKGFQVDMRQSGFQITLDADGENTLPEKAAIVNQLTDLITQNLINYIPQWPWHYKRYCRGGFNHLETVGYTRSLL
jgi:hypothetical protein